MSLLPADRIGHVDGFGMACQADGYVFRPTTDDEVREVLALARRCGRKTVLRGAGRSYGDASIAPEQVILDISGMNRILAWDAATGVIECEGGVTIEQLWRHCLPNGWWPPVVSGTMFPTLAGALGMNIHGKNSFAEGTLGEHVLRIEVMRANGEVEHVSQMASIPLIISSAGLLGVILRVKLQMKRVPSGDVRVMPISCPNWDAQFAAFEENGANSDYMVSWIDAFAFGSKAGRGLFHSANYAEGSAETLKPGHQDLPAKIMGIYPKSKVWKILRHLNNRGGMRLLNAAKHASSRMIGHRKSHRQSLVGFSFLLDYVPNWRWAYLPHGFIQYQSFVPTEAARKVFAQQLVIARAEKLEPFLAVMKRHRPDALPFVFSHAVDGYSLALDFKIPAEGMAKLQALCNRMSELVLKAGGRFYFAKDSTLRPADAERFLGEDLARFRAAKATLDPEGLFTSALAARLELAGD